MLHPFLRRFTCGPYLRAQIDREEILGHQTLAHHVVKDRGGSRGGDAGIGQTQDAIEGGVIKEGARLSLTETKDLVGDLNISHLMERRVQIRLLMKVLAYYCYWLMWGDRVCLLWGQDFFEIAK